ncbi:gamma-soluble NSF attachment protein-like isoform X2 [Plodia interpunctella]|uniref:gamma-soluble NSF attachment protein-like isoform X2 n=1 Tax=Plodia interpunctella TaxID=58824 RepID=UPI002367BDE8|nr:gamma-soluble NSF attachment protein-like isoform X2 [Plodia interpunctella]
MSAKLHEAQEHCKAAEKFLKTSLLKWKPDFDSAADEYSQAAQCYRIARDLNMSKECHLKASEYYKKNRAFFHAAKALENAIIVCKETASSEEICNLAMESSKLYQQHGSGDSGASVLDKAAKIIEENSPQLAVKLYQMAADVSSTESSQHQGSEYISKSSRILVRLQMYDQAVDSLRHEIGFHQEAGNMGAVGRLTVAIVLVQLARGDAVAAEKAYKEWGNNCEFPEMQTIEQLLQAYDEEDRESAKRALASPFIRNMDVEYARLATTIPLPEGIELAPKAAVRENAAPSYVSAGAGAAYGGDGEESPYEPVTYEEKKGEEDDLC